MGWVWLGPVVAFDVEESYKKRRSLLRCGLEIQHVRCLDCILVFDIVVGGVLTLMGGEFFVGL